MMKPSPWLFSALLVSSVYAVLHAIACSSPPADASDGDALESLTSRDAADPASAAPRKYAAIVGTWRALDAVPPASADGIVSYTTYTFAADGAFRAERYCDPSSEADGGCRAAAPVTGSWQVFTTLPTLPRIDLTWDGKDESYIFSLQCDLLVLDGIDAVFQHDLGSLPEASRGAICEDASWSSLARCPRDIGACDHETHRCLPPS